jgi:hypothetical protein
MGAIQSNTIVFLTGAFVSHACWNEWRLFFEEEEFSTLAPQSSITDFVVKDRTYFVLGLATWKLDATYILNWLNNH